MWIKEQSDAFFPVKVDYSSLPADPRELEDKLQRFKDAARVSWKILTFDKIYGTGNQWLRIDVDVRNFKDLTLQPLKLLTPLPHKPLVAIYINISSCLSPCDLYNTSSIVL